MNLASVVARWTDAPSSLSNGPLRIYARDIFRHLQHTYLPTIPTFPVIYRNLGVTPDIPGICTNIPRFYAFGCRVLVRVYARMRTRSCELNVIVLLFGANRPQPHKYHRKIWLLYTVESPVYRKSIDACTNLSAARFHSA